MRLGRFPYLCRRTTRRCFGVYGTRIDSDPFRGDKHRYRKVGDTSAGLSNRQAAIDDIFGKRDGNGFDPEDDEGNRGRNPKLLYRREFQKKYPSGNCRFRVFSSAVDYLNCLSRMNFNFMMFT